MSSLDIEGGIRPGTARAGFGRLLTFILMTGTLMTGLAVASADSASAETRHPQGRLAGVLQSVGEALTPAPRRGRAVRRLARGKASPATSRSGRSIRPSAATPLPVPRPAAFAAVAAPLPGQPDVPAAPALPVERPQTLARAPALPNAGPSVAEPDPDCAALAAEGTAAFTVAPSVTRGTCTVANPALVRAVRLDGGGEVLLEPPALMRCRMARALATWLRDDVVPAARLGLGEPPVAIRTGSAFECRPRNRVEGARMSEHGAANALDVMGFRLASGRLVAVKEPADKEAAGFLIAVRGLACKRFTTVLGPGSDAYHADHLHLDLIRRGRNGEARYCR